MSNKVARIQVTTITVECPYCDAIICDPNTGSQIIEVPTVMFMDCVACEAVVKMPKGYGHYAPSKVIKSNISK